MKKFLNNFHAGVKGFTILELVVVIFILGILSAVAIPNLSRFIGQSKTETMATELAIVRTSVVAYLNEHDGAITAQSGVTGATPILISPYLSSPLHGTYSWDTSGNVTQTAYS
jgi:prepilin-type N-terminal cleavage/methylation domain-containing protein